jgi:hypothetical protein
LADEIQPESSKYTALQEHVRRRTDASLKYLNLDWENTKTSPPAGNAVVCKTGPTASVANALGSSLISAKESI